jgi:integrase
MRDPVRLDAKTVAALTLDGKKDDFFWDNTLTGFGFRLRLSASGKKVLRSWWVQYRRAGATRRKLIGNADVVSAEQARAEAKKVLAKVALGEDPQADKTERRGKDRITMKSVVDEYLADRKSEWRAPTQRENDRYLTGPYFAPLHSMAVDKISKRDVAARLLAVKREHGPIVAAAARAKLSALFSWAMRQGLAELNPVIGTDSPKPAAPRERVLSDSELAAIWRGCGDDDYGRIIRLLILLGQRRQEIGGMRWWPELDLDAPQPTWTLPANRAKNGRAHTLPLMPMALDIIKSVPQMATRPQLFGSHSDTGFTGWDLGKQALDKRTGVAEWTPHDLRRTFSTRLHEELNIAPHVVEALLNHFSGHRSGSARPYNRAKYLPQMRQALAQWEDYIRVLVAGGERKVLNFQPPQVTAS